MSNRTKEAMHHAAVVSPRQAKRMAAGKLESQPSDYKTQGGSAKALDALHRDEDRRARKALQEWW